MSPGNTRGPTAAAGGGRWYIHCAFVDTVQIATFHKLLRSSLFYTSSFTLRFSSPSQHDCEEKYITRQSDDELLRVDANCRGRRKRERGRKDTHGCECVERRERRRGEDRRGAEEKPPRQIYKVEHLARGSRETRWSETKETKLKCHHRLDQAWANFLTARPQWVWKFDWEACRRRSGWMEWFGEWSSNKISVIKVPQYWFFFFLKNSNLMI